MLNELPDVDSVIKYQIFQMFKIYCNHGLTFKECYNIGYLGYLKAQKAHTKSQQMTLSFASYSIKHELHKAFQHAIKHNAKCTEELPEIPISDFYEGRDIHKHLSRLSEKEQSLIYDIYFRKSPKTYKQLGEKYNCSKQYIHQLVKKALKKLRNYMEN